MNNFKVIPKKEEEIIKYLFKRLIKYSNRKETSNLTGKKRAEWFYETYFKESISREEFDSIFNFNYGWDKQF